MEQPDLVKYLLICSIFNEKAISMILQSLLEKFGFNETFLNHFWNGVVYCAKLEEKEGLASE